MSQDHLLQEEQIKPLESGPYGDVAVLIPCFNEEVSVGKVVGDFTRFLPGARIFVYDNNSTDKTAAIAKAHGAIVVSAPRQGKGNVVRQMFSEVNADIYVMVDGDDTYPAQSAVDLISELKKVGADMVVGMRLSTFQEQSFRVFHQFGNKLVANLVSYLFSIKITDVMSGYRVFSKDFVKSIPLMSKGFEIETEMTLQAIAKKFLIKESPISYGERAEGSYSKLNTFSDGALVLKSLFMIFKDYKPMVFFLYLSAAFFLTSISAGIPPILDYVTTGFVAHIPLAILATGTGILSVLSLSIGLILDTINKYHNENFELLRRLLKKRAQERTPPSPLA